MCCRIKHIARCVLQHLRMSGIHSKFFRALNSLLGNGLLLQGGLREIWHVACILYKPAARQELARTCFDGGHWRDRRCSRSRLFLLAERGEAIRSRDIPAALGAWGFHLRVSSRTGTPVSPSACDGKPGAPPSRAYERVRFTKRSLRSLVISPGLPSPIGRPSSSITAITSAALPVRKHSSQT